MNKKFTKLIAAVALLVFMAPSLVGWGQNRATKTEGFETKATGTTYNSTVTILEEQSDCGIGWTIYYGNVSSTNYISGTRSCLMRYYSNSSSNLGYAKTTTGILGLTNITFNVKVTDTGHKMGVWYSTDEETWTAIATDVELTTSSQSKSYDIPNPSSTTTYFIKIGITSASTNKKDLIIDDVVFTYTSSSSVADPTFSPDGGNYTSAQNVEISCTTPNSTIYYTTNGTAPTNASTLYENAIPVSETTTIKAIAYAGEAHSEVATATYNILTPLTTMDAIFAKATEVGGTSTQVAITFNNWVVSGVNGSNVYVTDGTKGFIIYQSSHGFEVGNKLSGTAICTVELYRGSAELKGLTASTSGITVNTGGTITPQTIGIDALTGVNTGAVFAFSQLNCSKTTEGENTTVILTDSESNELKVYSNLFSNVYNSFSNGLVYNVTGVYQHYVVTAGTTKEIMPRSTADIELVTIPSITANNVNLAFDATSGEIPYTINNPASGGVLTAAKDDSDWISNVTVDGENKKVTFDVTQNMTDAVRSGVITLTYTYTAKETVTKEVTITQGVRDYATLPVIFDGGKDDLLPGFSQTGLGSDYDYSPKLRFDGTGDYLILKINEAATQLHFDIKGNSFSGGTFTVECSADGTTYSDLATYTELGATTTKSFDLSSLTTARYFKWTYTTKGSGNVALGYIRVSNTPQDIFVNTSVTEIPSGTNYVVYSPAILTYTGTTPNVGDILVEDGAQLIHANSDVNATLQKNVAAASSWGSKDGVDGWYTIASPVDNELVSTSTLATGDYDLYLYNEPTHEWWNAKGTHGFTTLSRGQGYLYANSAEKTINYYGSMKATNAEITVPLSYTPTMGNAKGFNLVGNPFTRNLLPGDVKIDGVELTTFYMVEGGADLLTRTLSSSNNIKPGQGFIVQLPETHTTQDLVFNPLAKGERSAKPAYVCIEAGDESFMDRAYVQIGEGNTLRKMRLNEEVPHVYVLHNQADYAAATIEAAEGEMPVCFTAARDGQYTLMVDAKTVETDYLHLIDNLTGVDIDLLQTPEYSFSAKPTDNASRFRLVFNANPSTGDQTDDEPFAYYNGSEWVINASGEATVLVIDILGRIVSSHQVNGTQSVSTAAMAPGVYVMRLVNGSNVKTQKIVVR